MSRIVHGTLTANVVATVSIDAYTPALTVVNRSQSGEIYFTVDGTTPVIESNGFVCLGSRIVTSPALNQATTIKLVSNAALRYTVEGETS